MTYIGNVSETPAPTRRGWLTRVVARLTEDEQELDAADLREDVQKAGSRPVYTPRDPVPTGDAELYDGSGSVHLVWLGRSRIPGIEPGRPLVARGRISEHDGIKVIFNPWYELKSVSA